MHPTELTIDLLESTLTKIESNLLAVAAATAAVPPCLFDGWAAPQLPTFTASLAIAALSSFEETEFFLSLMGRNGAREVREGGRVVAAVVAEVVAVKVVAAVVVEVVAAVLVCLVEVALEVVLGLWVRRECQNVIMLILCR
ncbi:unnamed protein product [Closterium sp. NIES-54]